MTKPWACGGEAMVTSWGRNAIRSPNAVGGFTSTYNCFPLLPSQCRSWGPGASEGCLELRLVGARVETKDLIVTASP